MKAEELMIGDWVYSLIDRDGKTVKEPQRIKGIWADGYNGKKVLCSLLTDTSDVWYSTGTFEPIPLTPEILLKNGFERDETHISTDFDLVMDGVDIFIIIFDDGDIVVDIEKNIVDGVNRLHHCEIKYVHQLQQAMRLCGIGKEIKL